MTFDTYVKILVAIVFVLVGWWIFATPLKGSGWRLAAICLVLSSLIVGAWILYPTGG